ncbi:MAG: CopG family antitoxin [Myxococcaceae bacterium]
MKDFKLDQEEQELLTSFENGEWKTVRNFKKEVATLEKAAKKFIKKDARINIRVSQYDLDRIKRVAAHEGMPYQTLIASVLHKFAAARV